MRINKIYLEASFISFLIHASIILYLFGYFYFEAKERSILSRPIEVNLVFKDEVLIKSNANQIQEIKIEDSKESTQISQDIVTEKSISFDSLTVSYTHLTLPTNREV